MVALLAGGSMMLGDGGGGAMPDGEGRSSKEHAGQAEPRALFEGSEADAVVSDAIEGLRSKAERVRILGSYPVAAHGIPGG